MSGICIREICAWADEQAPFETQLGFDNSGLLTGDPDWPVKGVHAALDVTARVLQEAEANGANLLLTHHPLLFSARKNLLETDTEGRLLARIIRNRMALMSCHTNLDAAPGGINDALAAQCGLSRVTGEGFVRVGQLPQPMDAEELRAFLEERLHTVIRLMGAGAEKISWLGVSSGAGGEFFPQAQAMGAQALLPGERKPHPALEMAAEGLVALEAGHFATEEPGIFAFADRLQGWLRAQGSDVQVTKSQAGAYAPPLIPD